MNYQRWRSKKLVEAKQFPRDGALLDPTTGKKEPFRAGDYHVREDGKERIVNREVFERTHERVYDQPPPTWDGAA